MQQRKKTLLRNLKTVCFCRNLPDLFVKKFVEQEIVIIIKTSNIYSFCYQILLKKEASRRIVMFL